jgi:hypothetical protein
MSTCDQKYLVVDYFFDELNRDEQQQFESHLAGCEVCQEHLAALQATSQVMKQQKRELPEKELLKNYHLNLKKEFSNGKAKISFIERILTNFIRRPSIAIRLAEAAVFILIGIFIGKTVIWNSTSVPESVVVNDLISEPSVEELVLKNYLQETEMIFLDVSNLDPITDHQLISNLVQSAKYKYLLQKTLLLRDEAKELENQQLSDVLNRIELILLELCNMEKNSYAETLAIIKKQLKDTHLLIEMKSVGQI